MIKELGFGTRFPSVPAYIDNTSALHVAGSRTYSSRVEHVSQELVKEGRINIHHVKAAKQLADIGTKHLGKHRQRYRIKLLN